MDKQAKDLLIEYFSASFSFIFFVFLLGLSHTLFCFCFFAGFFVYYYYKFFLLEMTETSKKICGFCILSLLCVFSFIADKEVADAVRIG